MATNTMSAAWRGKRHPDIAGQHINAGLLLLAIILVISDTATRSYFSIILFGDNAFGTFLFVNFCVILVFAGIACFQADLLILAIFAAIVAFFLSYYLYFVLGTGRPLSFNSLGGYYGALAIIVFYQLAKRNLLLTAMRMIFWIYAVYLVAYTLLSLADAFGFDVSLASKKVTVDITDPGRQGRLFIFQGAAAYVAMYSMSKLWEKVRISYLMTFALAAVATFLSVSRVFMASLVLVLLVFLVTRQLKIVQRFSFVCYLLMALYLMFGIFDPSFNPYWFASTDTSTLSREYQYGVVAEYVRAFPIFGIGLPDATDGLTYYLGRVIFPSDLDVVGIWFQFGLFGVVVIGVIAMYFTCIQNVERSSAVLGEADARTLSLTGSVIVLNGCHDLYVGMALLVSLIFANTLYNTRLFSNARRQSYFGPSQRRPQLMTTRRPPSVAPH